MSDWANFGGDKQASGSGKVREAAVVEAVCAVLRGEGTRVGARGANVLCFTESWGGL